MRILRSLFVGIFVLWGQAAWGQVFIEQGKVNLTVQPGETVNGEVTVNNTSNKELQAKVYWEDFVYQPPFDGAKKFMPGATSEVSLANWIQFSPREITLAPFGKKKISYTIQVPPGVRGGYYGVLFVEPDNPDLKMDRGVKIVTRVGCLFFVETADRIKQAAVEGIALNGAHLKGSFTNKGNVILLPQATYYIMNAEGVVADRGELKPRYLPPAQTADIGLDLSPKIPTGDYTIVLTFDLGDGDVIVKEADFTKNSDSDYVLKTVRD